MAKGIELKLGEAVSRYSFKKVDRQKLYGKKTRVPLDATGEPCKRSRLSDDGALILHAGMVAQGYYDSAGHRAEGDSLSARFDGGKPMPRLKSTLGVPQEAKEARPQDILDLRDVSVYQLDADDVDQALESALLAGKIFRIPFVYRTAFTASNAFVFATEEKEVFLLAGELTNSEWIDAETDKFAPTFAEEEDADELDFEMF